MPSLSFWRREGDSNPRALARKLISMSACVASDAVMTTSIRLSRKEKALRKNPKALAEAVGFEPTVP